MKTSIAAIAALGAFAAFGVPGPTMGWSSWNAYHSDICDSLIRSQADALVSTGLRDCGYDHVNIDDGWFGRRDENGRLHPHEKRFPDGLKPVVDYIHSKGLKAGAYSDAGENTCSNVCGGDPLGAGVGLYRHDAEDVDYLFRECGFDFIKVDYCGGLPIGNSEKRNLGEEKRYREIRAAIDGAGFPDVGMNICRWDYPGAWAREVACSWRVAPDINESWESCASIISESLFLAPYAYGGRYNDMDMLEVGRGMTFEEDRTQFAMWCAMASPLMIGCDLASMSPETLSILSNRELIAVNQDPLGLQAAVVRQFGPGEFALAKDLLTPGGVTRCLVFYCASGAKTLSMDFSELDLGGKVEVRELVEGKDLGSLEGTISYDIPAHGARVFWLKAEKRLERTRYPAHWAYLSAYQEISAEKPIGACYLHGMLSDRGYWHAAAGVGGSADSWMAWRGVHSLEGGEYDVSFEMLDAGAGFDVVVNGENFGHCDGSGPLRIRLERGMNEILLRNDSSAIGAMLAMDLAKASAGR